MADDKTMPFRLIRIIIKNLFKMVSSPYNNNTFDRKVYSCCASTSSFTVTSPLTAHGRSQSSAPPACTDRVRIKMATEGQSEYESVLCVKPEVNVYRIPPRASNRAIRWGGEGQARRWGGVSWAAGETSAPSSSAGHTGSGQVDAVFVRVYVFAV